MHIASGILGLEKTPINLRKEIYNKYGNDHKISNLVKRTSIMPTSTMVDYLDKLDTFRNTNWRETFQDIEKFYV
jgi:hypothetical protein